ncbi:MAG TPA: 3-deoxy-manno-octulosonate cytidylyltransferase [Acidimicrobiales bacterium]|nr:3-deoxy-manno-octulosonate cytidylyltransferase [Acidimicrobiales bacterium]
MRIVGVIPARYMSSRLEGKPLKDILGKPMIQHVFERVRMSKRLTDVIVATDDERVRKSVEGFGGKVVMTSAQHNSGTDRVAEAVANLDVDIVVNIQGDEPMVDPTLIDECISPFSSKNHVQIATVIQRLSDESTYSDPAVVKVVRDLSGRALYFSRSLIPFPRARISEFAVYEHIGIYAYTKDCLLRFSKLAPATLEMIEQLEQLRALEHGIPIHVVETLRHFESVSVDTAADLEKVRQIMAASQKERSS